MAAPAQARAFLFLQGPHGPFFAQLAKQLAAAGHRSLRAGFNSGDRAYWPDRQSYLAVTDGIEAWPARLREIVTAKGITDIVLYGDTRPVHALAKEEARALGLRIHVFEEGYLRPFWATYERDGSNGNSRLMSLTVPEMAEALAETDLDAPEAPADWGDMAQHVLYGVLYHLIILLWNRPYRSNRPHRDLSVAQEFRIYLRRFVSLPFVRLERWWSTRRILSSGAPFHIALLQLEHDSAFQAHSPFRDMSDFIALTIRGFAEGAPAHHHLVFKAHPLDSGHVPTRQLVRDLAEARGLADRVHFVPGGKLAMLLNAARTAITVNSTAGQQVLWRGMPLKTFGEAVYAKPDFVSTQSLPRFFAAPARPDSAAYGVFRRFLVETSQRRGGFYSVRGRRALLRDVVDLMLADQDPYDRLLVKSAAEMQDLKLVAPGRAV